jgi:hypothetical protein
MAFLVAVTGRDPVPAKNKTAASRALAELSKLLREDGYRISKAAGGVPGFQARKEDTVLAASVLTEEGKALPWRWDYERKRFVW